MPSAIIPASKPPTAILFPLFVLILSGAPQLKETVTGEAVFVAAIGRITNALGDTGTDVVTWIAFGVPAPGLDATMNENGRSRIRVQLPVPEAPDFR